MIVAPISAGILAFLFFALSLRAIAVGSRVSLGDGGEISRRGIRKGLPGGNKKGRPQAPFFRVRRC